MEELLTTKEVADFIRVNEKKIYQLVKDGSIPHVKVAGKWLFPRKHINRWIDENIEREKSILIAGSDDILLSRLISSFSQSNWPNSTIFYSPIGSKKGLDALKRRKAQLSCVHLLDTESGEYNLPYLTRIFHNQKYKVMTLWTRQQGFIVKKNNPLKIKALANILASEARFINRNEGSGTQLLLEHLIKKEDLNFDKILEKSEKVNSHLEIAQKVFYDEADVGIAIKYVSSLFPLDFIPIQEERFDLVIPSDLWKTPLIKTFINHISPEKISKLSKNLPGYNLKDTGRLI
ncbi:MAG: helix-turn-helix transcriptional regulator [Pseudomonadota bacterium]